MADGILSGLGSYGLEGLEGMSLFDEEKKEAPKEEVKKQAAPTISEKDFLLDKTTVCTICDTEFKTKAVKSGRARLIGMDRDLRQRFQYIDVAKYDVIMCPCCGYTALTRFFPTLMDSQRKAIKEKICANFRSTTDYPESYTYDQAIERYKLALVNAVVKGAKASEKAYICLKSAWILRGKAEEIGESSAEYAKTKALEKEYIKNAYEGFSAAIASERFPMCGMDETTINYLIAVLAFETDHMDVCQKMIGTILTSMTASSRVKDMTRELKDEVLKKLKAKA